MCEFLNRFKRTKSSEQSPAVTPETSPIVRSINRSAEPDLARLEDIWTTPGVLNGTLPYRNQLTRGVEVIDLDNRDKYGRPTHRSYPGVSERSPLDERLLEDFGDYGVIKGIRQGRVFYEAEESETEQSSE